MPGLGVWVGSRGFQPSTREMYECPTPHRTCLPGVRRYYKVGVKPREFRKTFLECLVVSYVILVVDMRFVIKMLALMALHLGERALHFQRQK